MKQLYIDSYYRHSYIRFMQLINDILDHPKQGSIEQRLKIIQFCDEFGFEATQKAFNKSRSTIYLWKKKLASADGKLSALAPGDRAPHRKRHRRIDPYVESFIIGYRTSHPGSIKPPSLPCLKWLVSSPALNRLRNLP